MHIGIHSKAEELPHPDNLVAIDVASRTINKQLEASSPLSSWRQQDKDRFLSFSLGRAR